MARLLAWDVNEKVPDEILNDEDLKKASQLIQYSFKVFTFTISFFREETETGPPLDETMWNVIEQCTSELVFSRGKFTRLAVLPRNEQIEALHEQFQLHKDWMAARAKKTAKLEKKLKVKIAGYQVCCFLHSSSLYPCAILTCTLEKSV